jgi:hypothetical protein
VGLTDGFTTNAGAATDISNVSSYTATGLSQSTLYYFVITPRKASGMGAERLAATRSVRQQRPRMTRPLPQ